MGTGYWGKRLMAREKDHDTYFYSKAVWVKRFAWWPKRCDISGRWLWLRRVMMGVAMYTGPSEPAFEFRWHDAKEHIFWRLSNGHI